MNAFLNALEGAGHDPLTSARASLESHLMAFAAEKARVDGVMLDMPSYRGAVAARLD